ncbi:MAG TPA: hypothetical protein VLA74_01845 [Nitrososphaeraceae archaeon]|nr:hypothetical protein [Nitrososphaeraceae archaeon]
MSSEQISKHRISTRKTTKIEKVYRKQDENMELKDQHLLMEYTDPVTYQDKNQKNIRRLTDFDDDNNVPQDQEQQQNVTSDAKEIANYSLDLHKDMINTYNSVYFQLLHGISNSSSDDFTIPKRFMDYPFDNKNMYTNSISNGEKSLKLIDNIMTKNMDTFIKSIELTKKFYKDVIESYWNCIKK